MPMPHAIAKQKIEERLKNLEGKARIQEIRKILAEIPQYKSGPYGEIRAELEELINKTRVRSKTKAREIFAIKKEGDFQFVLLGQPSSGKSTLLNALSGAHFKTADYDFTTLKPQAAFVQINGVGFQILDLPGIIEGAAQDKGMGKRILAVVRSSNGIIVLSDLSKPLEETEQIFGEIKKSGLLMEKTGKIILVGNKSELPEAKQKFEELKTKYSNFPSVAISAMNQTNFEELKQKLWETTGLIYVFSKNDLEKPLALKKDSTVIDFARKIHKELAEQFKHAKIYGPNAKFQGQKVGAEHILKEKDIIEIIT
jgi:small GTP-binding protein